METAKLFVIFFVKKTYFESTQLVAFSIKDATLANLLFLATVAACEPVEFLFFVVVEVLLASAAGDIHLGSAAKEGVLYLINLVAKAWVLAASGLK